MKKQEKGKGESILIDSFLLLKFTMVFTSCVSSAAALRKLVGV